MAKLASQVPDFCILQLHQLLQFLDLKLQNFNSLSQLTNRLVLFLHQTLELFLLDLGLGIELGKLLLRSVLRVLLRVGHIIIDLILRESHVVLNLLHRCLRVALVHLHQGLGLAARVGVGGALAHLALALDVLVDFVS